LGRRATEYVCVHTHLSEVYTVLDFVLGEWLEQETCVIDKVMVNGTLSIRHFTPTK
jgi:hypothetical protein